MTSEWDLLKKRLGPAGFVQEFVNGRAAEVLVATTDPDFNEGDVNLPSEPGFGRKAIRLRIDCPPDYPDAAVVRVLVLTKHTMSESLQQNINDFIENNKGRPILRNLLKWIDRKIGEWNPPAEVEEGEDGVEVEVEESTDPWTITQQIALENALRKYPPSLEKHKRWRKISSDVPGKTKRQCANRYMYINKKVRPEISALELPDQAEEEEQQHQQPELEHSQETKKQNPKLWTQKQQTSLDTALQAYDQNSYEKNERWRRIASDVPGKTKRECVERFKYVRELLLQGRSPEIAPDVSDSESSSSAISDEGDDVLPDLNPEERGLKGILTGMAMSNVGWCYAESMQLQCTCEECGEDLIVNVSRSEGYKQWCPSCSTLLKIGFNPCLLHNESQGKVGFFDVRSLIVQDLISCNLRLGCFECSKVSPIEDVTRSRPRDASCRKCHGKMRFTFQGWNLSDDSAAKLADLHKKLSAKNKSGGRRNPKDPRIVLGKPLPNNGTCKHYGKSHRWLRFPCCGVAYPCDLCHEEGSSCQETKWATRQICGYCAYEQAYSDKPCQKCGKTIGAGKATRHWEGGKGCRNQALMSTKDRKKYANSKLKTQSKKSERVGPKAKPK